MRRIAYAGKKFVSLTGKKIGRPPIGDRAMTSTERSRRRRAIMRRARLLIEKGMTKAMAQIHPKYRKAARALVSDARREP